MKPSFEKLCELLIYNPETGLFTRRSNRKISGSINNKGYVVVGIGTTPYRAHRLAWLYMTGEWPSIGVDHINGVKADNRWRNLRLVTQAENNQNSKLYKNSSSGVSGVSWSRHYDRWSAYINRAGRRIFLGNFDNFVDAVNARLAAEKELGFHPNHGRAEIKENADGTGR